MNNRWLLSLASGLLLGAGWYWGFALVALGMVPLLLLHAGMASPAARRGWAWWGWCMLAMLVWNALATWWIWNSTAGGALFAIAANAALMTIPLVLYRRVVLLAGERWGLAALPALWVLFEWGHMNWDLSWSWLNLGNSLALTPWAAQWYEVTGALGGTWWLLVLNGLLYRAAFVFSRRAARLLLPAAVLPLAISVLWPQWYQPVGRMQVVAVQPNIDPYTEKFNDSPGYIPVHEQVKRFIRLSETAMTDSTQLVLWPETAISSLIEEKNATSDSIVAIIYRWLEKHPELGLITGATTWRQYPSLAQAPATARQRNGFVYDVFNTAVYLKAGQAPQFYHKSKLVPGVEQMPYPALFRLLDALIIDLGGTTGTLGTQATRTVFQHQGVGIGPLICYESAYGAHNAGFVRGGAQALAIITNDAWWGNTPGHRHLLAYAALRAIEFRRDVARSANTGISAIVRADGSMEQLQAFETTAALQGSLKLYTGLTLYARFGDWLGWVAVAYLLLVLRFAWRRRLGRQPQQFAAKK